MSITPLNKLNIAKIFFFLFLASIFFPIRYVFPTKDALQTGAYSDFTSISLYLSDIFLFLTVIFAFSPRGGANLPRGESLPPRGGTILPSVRGIISLVTSNLPLAFLIFWLILGIILYFSQITELNWWFFAKYLELIVAYGTTVYLFNKTSIKQQFLSFFVLLTSFQSVLAIWQFVSQKSIGLGKVGEQVLSPGIIGVAKIVSSGTTYIRGYGTFPHPNLLSAFLVVGVLISAYLLINSTKFYQKALFSLALFINILGLTVTFSRAGFLAAGVGLIIFAGQTVINNWNSYKRTILTLLFLIIVSCLSSFIIFKPYLQTRATVTDQASLERIFYAKTAWKMIQHNPIFGVGIGESVIHMQQYSNVKLWPWQIQPAHNFFLLVTAELGIPGLILFLWFFISLLKKLVVSIRYDASNARDTLITKYLLLATFTSFLLLMQFDHYFYTLQQTQMLLWVFLGIIASQRKTPQEGELVL
jgi:O-antigen ligase